MARKKDKAEELLRRAGTLQEQFWSVLSELEAEVGFEIDGTQELPGELEELGDLSAHSI